jgi:VIT1/CCC1 family predicted Fe2+/Mn2+ transporter
MARRSVSGDLGDYLKGPDSRRAWALAAQDGIISTAGILLGFVGAGADEATLLVAGKAAIVAGMLTAGGAQWSETAAQREAELAAIAEELAAHRADAAAKRTDDRAELIAHYRDKGLSETLAAEVTDELIRRSPLKAALESGHGITELTSAQQVVIAALGAALGFGMGATVPLAIAWYVPMEIEFWLILLSVAASLIIVGVLGARAGRMDVRRTLLRTVLVAGLTIGVSFVVGTIGVEI